MDNKYGVYRQIRFNRTYRTLGKMSWWRIVLGAVLLASVFLISGVVSQRVAARGNFYLAEKLMVSPQWMEKHKPETKAFIEAGVLYQDGDYEAATAAFSVIDGVDAAPVMQDICELKLAAESIESGEYDVAYNFITSVDYISLPEENSEEYKDICQSLYEHFSAENDTYKNKLLQLLEQCSEG